MKARKASSGSTRSGAAPICAISTEPPEWWLSSAHSVPGHTPYTATSTSCSHSSPCTISRNQKISHASSGCVSQYPAKMSAE